MDEARRVSIKWLAKKIAQKGGKCFRDRQLLKAVKVRKLENNIKEMDNN